MGAGGAPARWGPGAGHARLALQALCKCLFSGGDGGHHLDMEDHLAAPPHPRWLGCCPDVAESCWKGEERSSGLFKSVAAASCSNARREGTGGEDSEAPAPKRPVVPGRRMASAQHLQTASASSAANAASAPGLICQVKGKKCSSLPGD